MGTIHTSDALLYMLRGFAEPAPAGSLYNTFPLYGSRLFPYDQPCSECGGTGDGGDESTYCQQCIGGGGWTIQGVITGQPLTVIRERKPHRFPVRCTFDVPLRPSRGIRAVPWPASPTDQPETVR